jgi:L-seryl-tRNA(Ser) seleniumtransferase
VKSDHDAIPVLKMMRLSKEEIGARANALAKNLHGTAHKIKIEIIDGESVIGGGAAPSSVLPTRLLAVTCADFSADELSTGLRQSDLPIIARVEEGKVLLDLRTVFPDQDKLISAALARIA